MTDDQAQHTDPLEFVETGLATLPANPSDATEEDLQRLAEISHGLLRIGEALAATWRELNDDPRTAEGADATGEVAARRLVLEVLTRREPLATERFNTYASAAFAAYGVNFADLMGGS
jgi:hypothetical protein